MNALPKEDKVSTEQIVARFCQIEVSMASIAL
jgi:hypothetical protein